MGIRFFCPQGHKLNVKSFLAGKTGFCPYCNAKVEIPLASTRESTKKKKPDDQLEGDSPLAVPMSAPKPTTAGGVPPESVPVAQPVPRGQPTPAGQTAIPVAQPASQRPTLPIRSPAAAPATPSQPVPVTSTPPAAAPAMPDPIAEAPQAVWYVRPATGGQFGPATGDIMSQWLDDGRVAPDSLVWREGWSDWKTAATTFPKFRRKG